MISLCKDTKDLHDKCDAECNVMRSVMCKVNNVVEQSKSSVLVFLKTEFRRWSVVDDEPSSV